MNVVALKYRLLPTKAQETVLEHTLAVCREVYNSFVNWRKHDYETTGNAPNYYAQAVALSQWKAKHPQLYGIHSQVLQNVAVRVDLAYKAFFRRTKAGETAGYPRMKGRGQYDSFTFPQAGFKIGNNTVTLSKIGTVKAILHRPIVGNVKTCTVRRQTGKWYVCFSVEQEPAPLPLSTEAVGIDVGLNQFAALSNGEFVANPRFFRQDEKALAKAGRRQAKTAKRSKERARANKVLSRIHERIRNRRHDFVHQTARKVVNRFGIIAVEKLNVKGMVKNHCLAKSISDASWSMFRSILSAKAESACRELREVNPASTSQTCSGCGHIVKKKLNERVHFCPQCGLSLDRDTNAAINILAIAVGQHSVAGIPA